MRRMSEEHAPDETGGGGEHTGRRALAVLVSGGLDSAILVGDLLPRQFVVYPLYVRSGMIWESAELEQLRRYLAAIACARLQPLNILEVPIADLLQDHWSINGRGVPDGESPDEAVFLPGRNVLLLAKAMLWCHLREVPEVALAILKGNPFPDATPAFFSGYEHVINTAVGSSVAIRRPYDGLEKREVMLRGAGLPLELTFSCLQPVGGLHCGRCNKCSERRQAFASAGMADPTEYASG
jgi:7-cyano-7-deazaguanine synthase